MPEEPGRTVRIPPGLRMVDGQIEVAVRLEPSGSPVMQARHQIGLGACKLGPQELTEEVVAAVPPAAPIEGDEQEVRLLERLEHLLRPAGRQHRVAERRRQPGQHRRAGQEGQR